jgi:hypothetical protein
LAGFIGLAKFPVWPRALTIAYMCGVTFVGVLFRDYAIIPAMALLFAQNPIPPLNHKAKLSYLRAHLPSPTVALPLLCGGAAYYMSQILIAGDGGYSHLTNTLSFLFEKSLAAYLLGWFIAFGPILALLIFDWQQTQQFLLRHQPLLVTLLLFAVIGYVGGFSTVVLLHWSAPIVFLLIGLTIERHQQLMIRSRLLIAVLLVSQMYSQRVFWQIPDFPNYENPAPRLWPLFSIPGNNVRFMDVLGLSTDYQLLFLMLFHYLLLTLATIVYLRIQQAAIIKSANVQEVA